MHINHLPEDILISIFKHTCYMEFYTTNQWEEKLLLLSICKKWRVMMLPMVYNYVSIFSTGWDKFNENTAGEAISQKKSGFTTTNATLFSENENLYLAKIMHIHIDCTLKPFPSILSALTTLESNARKWPQVKKLLFEINHDIKALRLNESNNVLDECNIDETVKRLTILLPSLTKIESKGIGQNVNVCALIGCLTANYNQQATHILSYSRLTGTGTQLFCKLKHLQIDFECNKGYQPPRASSERLEYLSLRGISHNNFWSCFANKNESENIKFTNLKTLCLNYENLHGAAREILSFPALQHLEVFSIDGINTVFEHGVFPQKLKNFTLQGTIETIDLLSHLKLPQTSRLKMNLGYHPFEENIDCFATINTISSKADQASVRLISKNSLDSYAIGTVDCPALTTLVLFAPINAEILVKLIKRLPNIYDLSVSKLQHAAILDSDEFLFPNKYPLCQAKTISSSIEYLTLRFTKGEIEVEKATLFAKYLLLRLPSLKTLNAGQLPAAPIRNFVKKQAIGYPFLEKTCFILKGRIGI
ncbi:hypothetical protein COEREDRAFT_89342 [Coemansia reversa NRRL 1564]|uniref:F-box domain-containing protein n=1 Tax=Coemansia reversa (strain ATCC 12441 / NRRL 1564) TaxID=763665 RepID=A0A2G5B3X6_COERN|nr:hypothetical protein COEREDRAFT_89342 [Coemansia reversa NRRL 1564]|eukprot:PIA13701.1 hypothetical protein COEREDRAFT_89342 [Coemansia reversa NRRL 1564]